MAAPLTDRAGEAPMAAKEKQKRKKTGETKRERRRQQGPPKAPDEAKVQTGAEAATFWESTGSAELTQGMVLRVDAQDDVDAFPGVQEALKTHAHALMGTNSGARCVAA